MKENSHKALIYAYYLSKFDLESLSHLGFKTWKDAYEHASSLWNIKVSTIKNMRDEFDSILDNPRAGWYQKPLSISRVRVHEEYSNVPIESFILIVKKLLEMDVTEDQIEFDICLNEDVSDYTADKTQKSYSIQRNTTGLAAEDLFIKNFKEGKIGNSGTLHDTRDKGCGYDFYEETENEIHYYEVKGRFENKGGLLITEKEWSIAKDKKEKYHLVLISNISTLGSESIKIYTNPAHSLKAKLNVRKVIQTSWTISESDL